MNFLHQIIAPWSLMRIIRLILGFFILYEGIQSKTPFITIFGVIFIAMPLFNIGCCGNNGTAPKSGEKIIFVLKNHG